MNQRLEMLRFEHVKTCAVTLNSTHVTRLWWAVLETLPLPDHACMHDLCEAQNGYHPVGREI